MEILLAIRIFTRAVGFAKIRIACICLVAFWCSGAFANTHNIGQLASHHLHPNHSSRNSFRSQLASSLSNSPPGLTLPAAQPFVYRSKSARTGEVTAKWLELDARISADEKVVAACRSDESTCSPAARRFLSIIKVAQEHEGRARLGWLNRSVNMNVKPASDWLQYGEADYWASPLQTLESGSGDCEDYAIVKYVALRALGTEADNLRLLIVIGDKRRAEHAVVAVRYEQQWLILDNLTMAVIAAEDARNYRPLFTLNSSRVRAVAAVDPSSTTKLE